MEVLKKRQLLCLETSKKGFTVEMAFASSLELQVEKTETYGYN